MTSRQPSSRASSPGTAIGPGLGGLLSYPPPRPEEPPAAGRWSNLARESWAVWPALAVLVFYAYGMAFWWGNYPFLDLRVYMGAAQEVLTGRDPYGLAFTYVNLHATYPPFALAVLSPLSLIPMQALVYLWSLASLACLAMLISIVLGEVAPAFWVTVRRRRRLLLAVLLALLAVIVIQPVRANFGFGQVNIFLITMVSADVLGRRRRSRGVLVGAAAAVKFTPLIYVVLFVLERDWGAVKRSVATFLGATGLAWLVAPGASAQYFLHFSSVEKRIGTPIFVSNQSLNGIITRLGLAGAAADGTWLALSLVVGVLAAMVARRLLLQPGRSMLLPLFVMATAGLLISPISWDHHWSWVALFPFALLERPLPRPVKAAFLAVITVSMAAFYWWDPPASHVYHIPTWFMRPVADDSLALAGLALVAAWVWALRKEISLRDLSPSALLGRPKDQLSPSLAVPGAEALADGPSLERLTSQRCQRWRKNTNPSASRALDWPE